MITLLCDFCCQRPMAAFYPCRSFAAIGKEDAKTDSAIGECEGWTACEMCQELIEHTAIEALAQRAHSLEKKCRRSDSTPIDYYRATFLSFFEHRTGPAYPDALEDASQEIIR